MTPIEVFGNSHIITPLKAAAREGRLAGAYLLEGPKGSGKRTLARYLTALFACPNTDENGPCFSCRDCETVLSGSHPDVFVFEKEKGSEHISVDMTRRANEAAMTAPIHAKKRVFIIPDATHMHAAAQNALLKNLEEPRSESVYLLLCESASGVLATIRSRCVVYRMELFDQKTVLSHLRRTCSQDDATLALAARLSGGSIGLARDFLEDGRMASCRKKAQEYLALFARSAGFDEFCSCLPVDVKKEFLPLFYRVLLSGVCDLLCACYGSDSRQFFSPSQTPLCRGREAQLMRLYDKLCELLHPGMANANVASSVCALNAVAAG